MPNCVYPRVTPLWTYTTVNFFKTFSTLSVCVKYLVFLKKKKNLPLPRSFLPPHTITFYGDFMIVLCELQSNF